MIDFFSNIELDKQSFWLGFLAGAIFLWFLSRLRIYLPRIFAYLRKTYQETREGLTSGAEIRYRNEILNYLQKLHITAPMFSLDEIIIPPRILVPPKIFDVDEATVPEDIVTLTIPYLPDWTELSARYNAKTIPISDVLKNGANILLIGYPGSGRTVSLAYLASFLLRRETSDTKIENLLPIYVHAQDLDPLDEDVLLLENISRAIAKNLSALTQQRLPSLLQTIFDNGRALLLIDGLDEIAPHKYINIKEFIQKLIDRFPDIRLVIATSPYKFEGFTGMGLIPLPIAAWNEEMINRFLVNFGQMWIRFVKSNDNPNEDEFTNILIRSWLESHNLPQGPLELTLRVWSAYAGDLISADYPSNIEAFIRRTTTELVGARNFIERIASDTILKESFDFELKDVNVHKQIQSDLRSDEVSDEVEAEDDRDVYSESNTELVEKSPEQNIQTTLDDFVRIGLLVSTDTRQYRFVHPEIACYLSGSFFSKTDDITPILEQEIWSGKNLTIGYYLHFNENGENLINSYLKEEGILQQKPLHAAHWLKIVNPKSAWHEKFLRHLAVKLQNESLTLGLSGRIMTALALTRNSNIEALLRKLLSSEQANIRQLAALGCGLNKDTKSVPELTSLINDPIPAVSRAACLALVAIGNKNALETVATALLQGSEMVRRYAAEALANHPEEGYPALRDGSKMEDLLVRRAVVFGLARVNQRWSIEILEQMQLEDQQWLVRNAAIQALEDLKREKTYIPEPSIPLTDTAWLIEFASKLGIGVAPGQPAIELLIRALKDGDEDLQLVALDYLRIDGTEEVIPVIIDLYHSSLGDVREAAFNTLWHMAAFGYNINIGSDRENFQTNRPITETTNVQ